MSLQLGDTVPDSAAESAVGAPRFHQRLWDHRGVFFSRPTDFTRAVSDNEARERFPEDSNTLTPCFRVTPQLNR